MRRATKSVSLFELELQAEVDKFVTTGMLLREQTGREPNGLHGWLFDSPTLAAELDERGTRALSPRESLRRQVLLAAVAGAVGRRGPRCSASCGTSTACRKPRSSRTSTQTSPAPAGRRQPRRHFASAYP